MSEAEWFSQQDPHQLLISLGNEASKRKLRLFCTSCVRRVWAILDKHNEAKQAIDTSEKYADDDCTYDELAAASLQADRCIQNATNYEEKNALRAAAWASGARMDAIGIARSVVEASALASGEENEPEREAQAHLLIDIFGNPFQPSALQVQAIPSDVIALAEEMYKSCNFQSMHQLADALERAGYSSSDILNHCRGPGPHVRGCWVVDLVLGKK